MFLQGRCQGKYSSFSPTGISIVSMDSTLSFGKRTSRCCYSTPYQGRQLKFKLGSEFRPLSSPTNDFRDLSTRNIKLVKSCALKGDLLKHFTSVHEGKKPFKCESSDFKNSLPQHIASVHEVQQSALVHERKMPFKCESCDYSCELKSDLQQHGDQVHVGKKPFKCVSCDKSIHLKSSLKQHVASVHEGKMSFQCESCDYSSLLRSELQQYVASIHEGKKPFKFQEGKMSFNSESLNVLTLNVCGLKSSGRIDQVRNLLLRYKMLQF